MVLKLTCAAALVLSAGACNTPTYECRDGRDTSGRGPLRSVNISCRPSGSELLCNAIHREEGYCTEPDRDVTTSVTWASSNQQIADFDNSQPGLLKVFATGHVTVSAREGLLRSVDDRTFFVSPGLPPRRDSIIELSVIRAGSIGSGSIVRIPEAEVEISMEGEMTQRCVTNEIGYCRFTARLLLSAVIDVSVRKSGYAPHQRKLAVNAERVGAALELTPVDK